MIGRERWRGCATQVTDVAGKALLACWQGGMKRSRFAIRGKRGPENRENGPEIPLILLGVLGTWFSI